MKRSLCPRREDIGKSLDVQSSMISEKENDQLVRILNIFKTHRLQEEVSQGVHSDDHDDPEEEEEEVVQIDDQGDPEEEEASEGVQSDDEDYSEGDENSEDVQSDDEDDPEIETILETYNDFGEILYFKESGLIVTNPAMFRNDLVESLIDHEISRESNAFTGVYLKDLRDREDHEQDKKCQDKENQERYWEILQST